MWVLVLFVLGNNAKAATSATIQFSNESLCRRAANEAVITPAYKGHYVLNAQCFQVGDLKYEVVAN